MKQETDPLGQGVTDLIDIWEGNKPAAEAEIAGKQELTNEQRKRIPYIVALTRMPCYLCEADPPCHFFLPWKTDDIAAPCKITAVCVRCGQLPDVYKRIEAELKNELA